MIGDRRQTADDRRQAIGHERWGADRHPSPLAPRPYDEEKVNRLLRNEADIAFKRRVKTVLEFLDLQDGDVVLDAGCGRGFFLNYLRRMSGCDLTGIELDFPLFEIAKRELAGLNIKLVNGDITHLPFPDNTFNKIVMSEVLEHIPNDAEALRQVYRVLKPGGILALTVPNRHYPFWWDPINKTLETLFHTHIAQGVFAGIWANHVRLYTRESLRQVMEGAGFQIEQLRQFTHYCFPFHHNIVYGFGKPLLEGGHLPRRLANAADRFRFEENSGSLWNPINLGLAVFNWIDRYNRMDEPPDRTALILAVKAIKPTRTR